jgi:hypothetical protein
LTEKKIGNHPSAPYKKKGKRKPKKKSKPTPALRTKKEKGAEKKNQSHRQRLLSPRLTEKKYRNPPRRIFFIFNTFYKLFIILAPKLFLFYTFWPLPTHVSGISTLPFLTWRSSKVADVAVGATWA